MKRPTFIGLALASLLALNACSPKTKKEADATKTTPAASAPKTLRFSAIPNQNSTANGLCAVTPGWADCARDPEACNVTQIGTMNSFISDFTAAMKAALISVCSSIISCGT